MHREPAAPVAEVEQANVGGNEAIEPTHDPVHILADDTLGGRAADCFGQLLM